MLSVSRLALFVPSLLSVRFGSTRWHWKRQQRRPKHRERRVFEAITQPIYPHQLDPKHSAVRRCEVLRKESLATNTEEENEYAQFLVRRIADFFDENKMIIVFHVLSMPYFERKEQNLVFKREGFGIKIFPNHLIKQYVETSVYRHIAPLLSERNMYVVSPEIRVAELVSLSKQTPDFLMLGGIVHDRILTRAGLEKYAQLKPLEDLLSETVAILNLGPQQFSANLQRHQQTLVSNLSQYVKDRSEGGDAER